MTAKEMAQAFCMDYHARRRWAYDPMQHAEYEAELAKAFEVIILAEREACVAAMRKAAEDWKPDCDNDYGTPGVDYYIEAIRARN